MSDPELELELEDSRPATVTAACILTAIVTAFVFMLLLLAGYGLHADRDDFIKDLSEARDLRGLDPDDIYTGLFVILGVLLLWATIAFVLSLMAYRGSNAARVLLVISSVVTAVLSLVTILTVVPFVTMICATAVAVMLHGRSARAWYARAR